ncbi:TetR/AcrR family transcriptional regulator [Paenibacillus arenilitoris]|uniref:TetR/AcrR family transcriptional regulator n=1 Tax=Paenibacillus arenilitoris TaxID=2772299 RepID=A0A927H965_9BACL|nr:TetR/AcrR family transcriptional regulator [Paenibacillus arenilitoris]MBD2872780.1 TetR/AcrR family transcriptional regulator [Paenibacillus arenilitoris]
MARTKEQNQQMSEATRNKIESAALQCFVYKGFSLTSMKDIAEAAGISTGLIYRHFSSKQDLFARLVDNTMTEMAETIRFLDSEGSPSDALAQVTSDLLKDIQTNKEITQYFILMTRSLLAMEPLPQLAELKKCDLLLFQQAARLIERGQKSGEFKLGDPYQLSLFFFAVIQGVADMKVFMGDSFIVPQTDEVMSFLYK